MPLIKRCQTLGTKPLVIIVSPNLYRIVVDTDLLVGVSGSDGDGKVVLESVVGREIELGKRGFRGVEFQVGGAEDKPKDENSKANDDNQRDYEFQKAGTAAAASATAGAVVGLAWRQD